MSWLDLLLPILPFAVLGAIVIWAAQRRDSGQQKHRSVFHAELTE
jgi:hypothetical protein